MNNGNIKTWETSGGSILKISEMTDNHINYCIKAIKYSYPEDHKNYEDTFGENDKKAQFNWFWTVEYGEKYLKVFQEELNRRKL